jgi:hypothetical protein
MIGLCIELGVGPMIIREANDFREWRMTSEQQRWSLQVDEGMIWEEQNFAFSRKIEQRSAVGLLLASRRLFVCLQRLP